MTDAERLFAVAMIVGSVLAFVLCTTVVGLRARRAGQS